MVAMCSHLSSSRGAPGSRENRYYSLLFVALWFPCEAWVTETPANARARIVTLSGHFGKVITFDGCWLHFLEGHSGSTILSREALLLRSPWWVCVMRRVDYRAVYTYYAALFPYKEPMKPWRGGRKEWRSDHEEPQ